MSVSSFRKTTPTHRTVCSQLKRERDAAMTAAIINAETIREQSREFQATITELSKQLAAARRELRILLNAEVSTIVEYAPEKYASVEMILAFPGEFGAHQRCSAEFCDSTEPHVHEGGRS